MLMPDPWMLKAVLGGLLLPPATGLLLLALAWLLRKHRGAVAVAVLGGLALLLPSLPLVATALIATLETRAGPPMTDPQGAKAIVILGGGLARHAPEYGGETVNERSLVRTRYGAFLARRYQLPVLVSGGAPIDALRAESDAMSDVLAAEFGVPVRWREGRSRDTADNARYSAQILRAEGIQRVILVTEAFHMPRARQLFEAAGLQVVSAPTGFKGYGDTPTRFDFLPQAKAMQISYYALHEWLGIGWPELVHRYPAVQG